MPIYAALEREGLPLLIHAGRDFTYRDVVLAAPKDILAIQKNFPFLTIIAAHMGGMFMRGEAEKYLIGSSVYIDTALSCRLLSRKEYMKMIKEHDPDRIMFGSDFPWNDPKKELDYLMSLDITEALKEKLLWGNAAKLYGFDADASRKL
ncbi:hypothetical protein SDC9_194073 [bioreactor metagenome]|uniref:Amidohydrolase-related domain-containing protein n=1 Tax=bioreactor metagenome TaxID=1076179 RepID=A0A645I598_9ZZZZ